MHKRYFWIAMPKTTGGTTAMRPSAALAPYICPVIAEDSEFM